jgi:hypothetical protein
MGVENGFLHPPDPVGVVAKTVAASSKTVGVSSKPVGAVAKPVGACSKTVAVGSKAVAVDAKTVAVTSKAVGASDKTVGVSSKAVAAGSKAVAVTFKTVGMAEKSGRGLPQSKTLRANGGEKLAKRLGVRREAKRHAAFVRATSLESSEIFRPPESGVAAALCHRSPKPLGRFKPNSQYPAMGFMLNRSGAFPQK